MMHNRKIGSVVWAAVLGGLCALGCGGSDDSSDGASGAGSNSQGAGGTSNSGNPANQNTANTTGSQTNSSGAISATPIRGGGDNSAPLGTACGPETAHDCHPIGGDCTLEAQDEYELISAVRECFFSVDATVPKATIEYVIEALNGQEYIHLRATFDPDFVDTVYGECAANTGWGGEEEAEEAEEPGGPAGPGKGGPGKGGHTFNDLVGSDHIELALYDCSNTLAMELYLDFISESTSTECGYASLGVSGGEGKMILGDASHVLAATSSLDRNMNGCGYCETENSPCTDQTYQIDPNAPDWDFRVSYEVWIAAEAFGAIGFCRADIDSVHASPSKASENTIEVTPDQCDGSGGTGGTTGAGGSDGGDNTGGEDGVCPPGYTNTVDLTSEDILCVPE